MSDDNVTLDDMTRGNVDVILAYCGKRNLSLDDIDWDAPVAFNPPCDVAELLAVTHAIGVVCGIAAGLDVTPLEMLWNLGINTEAIEVKPAAPALPAPTDRRRAKRSHAQTINAKNKPRQT